MKYQSLEQIRVSPATIARIREVLAESIARGIVEDAILSIKQNNE